MDEEEAGVMRLSLRSRGERELLWRLNEPRQTRENVLYLVSGKKRDPSPLTEAEVWARWLRDRGVAASAVVASVPAEFRRPYGVRDGAAVQVPADRWRRSFALLLEEAGGFRLRKPTGLEVDDCRITDASVVLADQGRVFAIARSQITGIREESGGGDDPIATYLRYTDWQGRPGEYLVGSRRAVDFPALLAVADGDLVRQIYDAICAGRTTGVVAEDLNADEALGSRAWTRTSVRTLVGCQEFNQGKSAVGVIDDGVWRQAQQAVEREVRARGALRERVLPATGLFVFLAFFVAVLAAIVVAVAGGIYDMFIPAGSRRAFPIWLSKTGSLGDDWRMKVISASQSGAVLDVDVALTHEARKPMRVGVVLSHLRAEAATERNRFRRASPCAGGLAPSRLVGSAPVSGSVCFLLPPEDAGKDMLLVERLPGSEKKVVWFALRKQPNNDGGDGGA